MEDVENPQEETQPSPELPLDPAPAPLPKPLHTRPALQALAWVSGIVAGGFTFMTVMSLSTVRLSGATRGARAQWQLRHKGVTHVLPPTAQPAQAEQAPAESAQSSPVASERSRISVPDDERD
ncbi:MAG TPA: hypothetical protein P5572_06330 [Phycisphaerae bacterium]|mgnify:CR=1 FL=1|nr:hypothetical protein [Phycisphaerae bacterium]